MDKVVLGDCELYLADCLEILPTLEAGSVDAVVTDPPYGMAQHRQGGERSHAVRAMPRIAVVGDNKPFDPRAWLNYPIVCLFGANHYANLLPVSAGWLVWDKRDGGTSDGYSDAELAWTNVLNSVRLFHHKWRGMIKASERGECRVHPTQKPVILMQWAMDTLRITRGSIVLDPYMGSGTTGVACVHTGRKFVGIEISEAYFNIAVKRITQAYQQLRLPLDG